MAGLEVVFAEYSNWVITTLRRSPNKTQNNNLIDAAKPQKAPHRSTEPTISSDPIIVIDWP